ncbi:type IV pilin [Natronoarchaeum mannanilyticum]|uniref:Archaeal Type IV pilin N-terminal domain-containing protein n=1 Tax=Natronoarchaeum mannanilyticum TaxID=926360 RepID=A0AAV3TDX9_9EURY
MQFDALSADDRAVASMLGVTLLLGTAVVGAAVVGAFVLDVGSTSASSSVSGETQASQAPQVQWELQNGSDGVTLQHVAGDTVQPGQVRVVGDLESDYVGTRLDDSSLFGEESVRAGDEATIDESRLSGDTGTVALIWTSSDGSDAVVLSEYEYDLR